MNPILHIRVAIALTTFVAGNIFAAESLVYFGTFTTGKSQGIYVSRFDSTTGKLSQPELAAKIKNPTFLAVPPSGKFLHAGSETTNATGKIVGRVVAYDLDQTTGRLTLMNEANCAGSGSPCHLALDATHQCLFVANYGSGTIAALPVHGDGRLGEATTVMQHTGSGPNPKRQAGPHAHFILPSPDNRFTLDCDLGLDKIFINRLDAAAAKLTANDPPSVSVAPGSGPRHLVFSKDSKFVYVINELASSVTVFHYAATNAGLTEVQTVSTLPPNFATNNTAAEIAIHPNGKFLYGSNRGHDSIAVFAIDSDTGKLTLVEHQSTLGHMPRNFAIAPGGRWLIAENQASDSVAVFSLDPDTGKLQPTGQTITIAAPVCSVFVETK
jgi:6-phosphogluconolactonase